MSTAEASASSPGQRSGGGVVREAFWAYLNLAVLWTFAVAQPLFDLLKDNAEFFAARGSSGSDIVSFAVLLIVVPPALLFVIELLVGPGRPQGPPRRPRRPDRLPGGADRGPGASRS